MDYQTWLKAFGVELSNQWNGISIEDLDPLHLQSFYHRGISPLEAARQSPVLKDVKPAPVTPTERRSFQWLYVCATIAAMLAIGLVWRVRHTAPSAKAVAQLHGTQVQSLPLTGGYPSETVNYGAFSNPSPLFAHTLPYRAPMTGFSRHMVSAGPSEGVQYVNGNIQTDDGSGNPSGLSPDSSLPTQVRSARPSSSGGGGSSSDQQVPTIQQFQVTSLDQTTLGYSGQITWQVTNADEVQILVDDTPMSGVNTNQGNIPFSGLQLGATVTIRASKGGRTVEQSATVDAVQG